MKRLIITITAVFCIMVPCAASVHNVKDYGAKGDGVTIDSPAINATIKAAASEGGGMVYIPSGTYASYTIRLESHIHLYLEKGAVLKAAEGEQFDAAEPGPDPQYQDFGHSHWKNSLIWGIGIDDVTISGEGMIDGSNLSAGYGDHAVKDGIANKMIALKDCRQVVIRDITMFRGGHFCLLATGIDNLLLDGLTVDTNRDGLDIDCCRNVRVTNCNVNSPFDDGIVLKASYAMGRFIDTRNVAITNCNISGYDVGTMLDATYKPATLTSPHDGRTRIARSSGRIKLGTESSGGFKNIAISNCTFDFCGGILIESMDGGYAEDIVISNLTMRDCLDTPLFVRLGSRMRSPEGTEIGRIRRVLISDVNAYNTMGAYGVIISGIPGHDIEDFTLRNIHLNYTGGFSKEEAIKKAPENERAYPDTPMFSGNKAMPAKGIFMRHTDGFTLDGVHFSYEKTDTRPLFFTEDVKNLIARDITLEGKPVKVK